MKNLKNEGLKAIETTVRSIKGWRVLSALALVAAFAAPSAAGGTQLALADDGGVHGHTFNVTFTKWITSLPANPPSVAGVSMAGVVGGAVGDGRFAGLVLGDDLSVPGFWLGHARYEFHGEGHSFIADVHVTENDTVTPNTAVITGLLTPRSLEVSRRSRVSMLSWNCRIASPSGVLICSISRFAIRAFPPVSPDDNTARQPEPRRGRDLNRQDAKNAKREKKK